MAEGGKPETAGVVSGFSFDVACFRSSVATVVDVERLSAQSEELGVSPPANVIPAQAGIHNTSLRVICPPCSRERHREHGRPRVRGEVSWVAAFAGMTLAGGLARRVGQGQRDPTDLARRMLPATAAASGCWVSQGA